MKKVLLVLNGPACGADETFNAVRLAVALARRDDTEVTGFLMGDAVTCAIAQSSDRPHAEQVWLPREPGCVPT